MGVFLYLEASQPYGKTYRLGFGCNLHLASMIALLGCSNRSGALRNGSALLAFSLRAPDRPRQAVRAITQVSGS
jgi:hypothetical protein